MPKGPHSDRIGVQRVPEGKGETIADAARKASERLARQPETTESSSAQLSISTTEVRADILRMSGASSEKPPVRNPDGPVYKSSFKVYQKDDADENPKS